MCERERERLCVCEREMAKERLGRGEKEREKERGRERESQGQRERARELCSKNIEKGRGQQGQVWQGHSYQPLCIYMLRKIDGGR